MRTRKMFTVITPFSRIESDQTSAPATDSNVNIVHSSDSSNGAWRSTLRELTKTYQKQAARQKSDYELASPQTVVTANQALWFVLSFDDFSRSTEFKLKLMVSTRKKNGDWSVPVAESRTRTQMLACPLRNRAEIHSLSLLKWPEQEFGYGYGYYGYSSRTNSLLNLSPQVLNETLLALCATGRFVWCLGDTKNIADYTTIQTDPSECWRFVLQIVPAETPSMVRVRGVLKREQATAHIQAVEPTSAADPSPRVELILSPGEVERDLDQVVGVCDSGAVLFQNRIGTIPTADVAWLRSWRGNPTFDVPRKQVSRVLEKIASVGPIPNLEIDPSLQISLVQERPVGLLRLTLAPHDRYQYLADFSFRYGSLEIKAGSRGDQVWNAEANQVIRRDLEAEARLLSEINGLPFVRETSRWEGDFIKLPLMHLAAVVTTVRPEHWEVYVSQRRCRSGGQFQIDVTSGVDWFDVQGSLGFEGAAVDLPEILRAIRHGEKFVLLNDGTQGLLPESLFKELRPLTDLSVEEGSGLRFKSSQALLLEALLSERKLVSFDQQFQNWCQKLKQFSGIQPATQPRGFKGKLRTYQQEGLGWLNFLNEFRFGGCLADDMGLGKTIQVLALLEKRRQRRLSSAETRKPSLVLVPKSLVFNWIDEAKKFAPRLKIIDYTGLDRVHRLRELTDDAVLLTTYHTFRLDVARLKDIQFDYAILDEAQAIKNSTSQASKAVRLIQADHRLAMTGTPVENHLGDLWSLFDFLNPGMLGPSLAARTRLTSDSENGSISAVGQALRPFILRRTKSQVLTELPAKTEQTLYCDLDPKQRKHYNQIRDHFRAKLLSKVETDGIQKSKIHVLEALLRLRQAACDLRLVDATQKLCGAKLEVLVEQLEEVIPEGHKVLIFSQFTSYLSLIRKSLDQKGWKYQYLDGKTNNRADEVKRFQEDANCSIFLISLKAGGHGLNLTAADYVYIMDPWWNPAVEAQAIDRAHRMGQQRPVTAYRVIARDTIEEKILQLQQSKRELADAIIEADKSLLQKLSLEDIRILFE